MKVLDNLRRIITMHNMILGRFKPIDYRAFRSPVALDQLESNRIRATMYAPGSCGTNCIQTLTGLTGRFIERQRPKARGQYARYWSDTAMMNFLRQRGFRTEQLTKLGVACERNAGYSYFNWETPITPDHVLVCNLLMDSMDASWIIITQNVMFHNFIKEQLNPLLLVNRPSQTIWMVTHEKWKKSLDF